GQRSTEPGREAVTITRRAGQRSTEPGREAATIARRAGQRSTEPHREAAMTTRRAEAIMRTLVAVAVVAGCAPALPDPQPVSALAPHQAHGRTAGELERDADAAWARRGQPGQAAAAQALYLDAAAADEHRVDGLLGAMRAMAFRIEHETTARGELAK